MIERQVTEGSLRSGGNESEEAWMSKLNSRHITVRHVSRRSETSKASSFDPSLTQDGQLKMSGLQNIRGDCAARHCAAERALPLGGF